MEAKKWDKEKPRVPANRNTCTAVHVMTVMSSNCKQNCLRSSFLTELLTDSDYQLWQQAITSINCYISQLTPSFRSIAGEPVVTFCVCFFGYVVYEAVVNGTCLEVGCCVRGPLPMLYIDWWIERRSQLSLINWRRRLQWKLYATSGTVCLNLLPIKYSTIWLSSTAKSRDRSNC